MEWNEVIRKRRSIRQYTDEPVSEEQLRNILRAGLYAPTSMNRQPCSFYVIRDKETLEKLSKVKPGAGTLAKADKAIVVAADSRKADTWIEDSSIALSTMHLATVNEGLGSCWIQIHLRKNLVGKSAEDSVRKILDLKEKYRIVGILALGHPVQEVKPHAEEDLRWDAVHGMEG